ncbi:AAA family ATPase [Hymenobacter sp. HD11105]
MLLKRIKAQHFKTYQNLDLDLTVPDDRPIILIGGANGGGKTTLFEAIYGGLYGLKIKTARDFEQLLNAGVTDRDKTRIVLELHFAGKVLQQEQQYILTRTYLLNPAQQPMESVTLNMDGNLFTYGSAMAPADRKRAEAEVNKIIKANLPQELSRYFLFDAMESGNLLKQDQLNLVIRENIENVMGFQKYAQLAHGAELLVQQHTASRLELDKEKEEYKRLTADKQALEEKITKHDNRLLQNRRYSVEHQDTYQQLQSGLNAEETLNQKIKTIQGQMLSTLERQRTYREGVDSFVRSLETHVGLPQLHQAFRAEIGLVVQSQQQQEDQRGQQLSSDVLERLINQLLTYLQERRILTATPPNTADLVRHLQTAQPDHSAPNPYAYLDSSEVRALTTLLHSSFANPFPPLASQQSELQEALATISRQEGQIEEYKAQISGHDYTLLKAYEQNEADIKRMEVELKGFRDELKRLTDRIHQFDIQVENEPDPRLDALQKLSPFFREVANLLLRTKKKQIESQMLADLNMNLVAYQGVIQRVELSEELRDLTFRLYHTAGNEIYLDQLNTASKQVVVQCLLKALHEFGDYDPPVMIDTVMGVLDESSRATMLESYFPRVSHQTILLSSDSEIRLGSDLERIRPFLARTYTLARDKQNQCTEVCPGYFGEYPVLF